MLSMLEELRTDLIAGALTDWGICSNPRGCSDSSEGYLLADKDEISLRAILKKWSPYVIFDFKPVMTVDQTINGIKKAAATIKK
jgi:hypothetical protein